MTMPSSLTGSLLPLVAIGTIAFCLLGPYSYLGGAFALDFGGKQAGAVSSGIIDGVGYLGAVVAGYSIARVSVAFGWKGVFVALAGVSALAALGAGYLYFSGREGSRSQGASAMTSAAPVKRIWSLPDLLNVEWADGTSSEFASLWLRDNLRDDRDPHSGQRLVDIPDLPENPRIRVGRGPQRRGEHRMGNRAASRGLRTRMAARTRIESLAADTGIRAQALARRSGSRCCDATSPGRRFSERRDNRALRAAWMARLLQDGIAFLSQVPSVDAGILEAASLIGRVSETNYGQVFDVRSVPQPENLAYSDLGLGLHTDNPYREPVPGFQVLHALIASPDGGESLFGDGFAIAEHLRGDRARCLRGADPDPSALSYRSKDAELYAERPLIQLTCSGEVSAVHYNSRSIAPLQFAAREAAPFYSAYRRFAALLRDPRYHLQLHLGDGDLVVFDNQRTLHGRTAFSSANHPRHLRGCYLTRDSVYSAKPSCCGANSIREHRS